MRRLLPLTLLLALVLPLAAHAQAETGPRIEVLAVSGPLDSEAIEYLMGAIESAPQRDTHVALIQLSSPAVVATAAEFQDLMNLVSRPPVPLAVWLGPAPAVAYGGITELVSAVPLSLAAPGAEIGYSSPTIAAGRVGQGPQDDPVTVGSDSAGDLVDFVAPSLQQAIQSLDGSIVTVGGTKVELATLPEDNPEVVLSKPGLWARFLRLSVTPEAAFLFLLGGLTIAAFEFYAIGPGAASAMAAISLFLSAYGISTLPVRWWALLLTGLGWFFLTWSYQRGSVAALTGIGSILSLIGGLMWVDGAPQLTVSPVVTALIVVAVVTFYTVAMPTVARSRFSTPTIGRDHLIGREGEALGDLEPDGEVLVGSARWKATSHRAAGIKAGDIVRIVEVDGVVLEVEPTASLHESAKTK